MRPTDPIRRIACLAIAPLLAACPVAGMHAPAVEVRLAAAPARDFAPGDTVRLTAEVRNPGRDTLRMRFDAGCPVLFFVRAESDQRVVEPPDGVERCEGTRRELVLAPGNAETFTHAWVPGADLPPGAYTAYAIFEEHHLIRGGDRSYKAAHRSNEAALQMAAP